MPPRFFLLPCCSLWCLGIAVPCRLRRCATFQPGQPRAQRCPRKMLCIGRSCWVRWSSRLGCWSSKLAHSAYIRRAWPRGPVSHLQGFQPRNSGRFHWPGFPCAGAATPCEAAEVQEWQASGLTALLFGFYLWWLHVNMDQGSFVECICPWETTWAGSDAPELQSQQHARLEPI